MRFSSRQLLSAVVASCLFACLSGGRLMAQGGLTLDFNDTSQDALEELGIIFLGNAQYVEDGGFDNTGYLNVTNAENSQNGAIILPDLSNPPGSALESFRITADLRVGGGTADPADGFSFNLVRPDDPLASAELTYAGIGTEASLPEEGSRTGLGIGFDEWQSGPTSADASPESCGSDLTRDCIGISVRIDGELLVQIPFPVKNGDVTDQQSLQTGAAGADAEELGWATLDIQVTPSSVNPETENNLFISYKDREVFNGSIPYQTSPGQLVFGGRTGGANSNHHIDNISIITDFTGGVTGDFNADGAIDLADFAILASNMNTRGLEIGLADGDIDFNRRVDLADFAAFRRAFAAGAGAAAAAVPEPTACMLTVFAALGLVGFRRRRP